MKKFILFGAVFILSSCSTLTDMVAGALTSPKDGISVDAQVGSNENKVDTGVGSIGNERKTQIDDNEGTVSVQNQDGKFHIRSNEGVNIVVEETNTMVYYLMGFFFLLTVLREFLSWRKKQ